MKDIVDGDSSGMDIFDKTNPEGNLKKKKYSNSYFSNPVCFLIILLISTVLKSTATGYSSGVFSTLEKRFQLKSTQIGVIAVIEDIIGLSTVMPIVHFGQSRHRPRVIGVLTLLMAIGVLMQSVPHFIYRLPLSIRETAANLSGTELATSNIICYRDQFDQDSEAPQCTEEQESSSGSLIREAFWIPLGASMISLGSGIGPISLTYLDDNVPKRSMPVYAGIIFSVYAFGSLFGFFLASFCLAFPVVFPLSRTDDYSAEPGDINWLGAWWLGYIMCGTILWFLSFAFFMFPRQLRDPEELALEDEEYFRKNAPQGYDKEQDNMDKAQKEVPGCNNGPLEFIKDFIHSLSHVFRNVVVMAVIFSGCFTAFGATGFFIFGPKFSQVAYELDPSFAALTIGIFLIPGAMTGQILGGVIIKRLNLSLHGMGKMFFITALVVVLSSGTFYMIRCEKRASAGLTVPYSGHISYEGNSMDSPIFVMEGLQDTSLPNIESVCNDGCGCSGDEYKPVCGSDGITYNTACLAGCTSMSQRDNKDIYTNCSCIPLNDNHTSGHAIAGECHRPCSAWIVYMLASIPISLMGTMAGTSGFMIQLRSVDKNHRGLAMSLSNILLKVLGYIPGPLVFGLIIENACLFYQTMCGKTGNCIVYHSDKYMNSYISLMFFSQIAGFACICVAFFFIRKHRNRDKVGMERVPTNPDSEVQTQGV